MTPSSLKEILDQQMDQYDIVDWGYTNEIKAQSYDRYNSWVEDGHHGTLSYLSDYRKDARKDLSSVLESAQSALTFLFSYHPEKLALEEFYKSDESNGLKVAGYITGFNGQDYHLVIRERLKEIASTLETFYQKKEEGPLGWRQSLDIQPVLERDLAYRCGLGWFGRNSMLINRHHGSYFIIGSLIFDRELDLLQKSVETDLCGQCRACVDACPTQAIDGETRVLEANQCISSWTIELFKEGPEAPKGMEDSGQYIFGCDICQEVCPWNKRPLRLGLMAQRREDFFRSIGKLKNDFLSRPLDNLIDILKEKSNRGFSKEYRDSPLGRTGRRGLLKNLQFWKKP